MAYPISISFKLKEPGQPLLLKKIQSRPYFHFDRAPSEELIEYQVQRLQTSILLRLEQPPLE
jgi:hypothetical protein